MNNDFLISFAYTEHGNIIRRSELEEKHRFDTQVGKNNRQKTLYNCPGCNKKLYVKQSQKDNYHFSHFENEACLLSFSKEWAEYIDRKYCSNESEAHKKYKNEIAQKLSLDKLNTNIQTEKYIDGLRTDVYCERGTGESKKQLAFEIQLSPLKIETIKRRDEHYKEKGIHLFWILAYKDDTNRTQKDMELYGSSPYEICNEEDKLLICHYKVPKVFAFGKLFIAHIADYKKAINLSDLKINKNTNEIYLLDLDKAKSELNTIVEKINKLAIKPNRDEILNLKYMELSAKKVLSSPLFEQYSVMYDYVNWLEDDEELASKSAIEAAKSAIFYGYIKFKHTEILIKEATEYWGDTEDKKYDESKMMHYFLLPCPKCKKYYGEDAWDGFILNDVWATEGACKNCGYEGNLVDYLADLYHDGNKQKAAEEICHNEHIPYSR